MKKTIWVYHILLTARSICLFGVPFKSTIKIQYFAFYYNIFYQKVVRICTLDIYKKKNENKCNINSVFYDASEDQLIGFCSWLFRIQNQNEDGK